MYANQSMLTGYFMHGVHTIAFTLYHCTSAELCAPEQLQQLSTDCCLHVEYNDLEPTVNSR